MNPPDEEQTPVSVQIPTDSATRKLRESASLPPAHQETKRAIESTGRLPAGGYRYQMSDVLALAIQSGASDLHLRVGEPPVYRVDGKLIRAEGPPVDADEIFELLRAFTPDDSIQTARDVGQADFGLAYEHHRFRVNVFRAQGYWGAVLRRIPEKMPQLEDLLAPQIFYDFTRLPRGLVLVTGPTGSGKTTTLAAMMDLINTERSDVHILSLEDPIEFKHSRKQAIITQRELGTDFVTFADGLRAGLREDPDIIMVGEMRDPETMEAALLAAETGHLVFSTVHTIGAKDTVDRIINAFPKGSQDNVRAQLSSILRGVISQTLMPRAAGKGRVAAFEIMVGTPAVANLIRENNTHQIPGLLQTHSKDGMCTLDQSLAERYAAGLITRNEALERAQDLKELIKLLETVDQRRK
ncbi:MAG TPA: type IV pilus twitching motility protein PilT [Verrucomicrobiae bacterium]|jgi:twitching motility protein PilT|nr:type IV pilus twitching motility protein PilT [Verrucomicrobiae bacterium]